MFANNIVLLRNVEENIFNTPKLVSLRKQNIGLIRKF